MKKGIKFHSIYYRFFVFIWLLAWMLIYRISLDKNGSFCLSGKCISAKQIPFLSIGVSLLLLLIFSFVGWKLSISQEGIYLKKIDLLVPWDEVESVSHVWINEANGRYARVMFFYNRKTLVVYRKSQKPICIYNISVLALYGIYFYNPKIKTNVISATLATLYNLFLNAYILYIGFIQGVKGLKFGVFLKLSIAYAIKVLVMPLWMVWYQNRIHGKYLLHHDHFHHRPSSNVIHL